MKAVFIAFNQAHSEKIEFMLEFLGISGYTLLQDAKGRGTNSGEPRMGTHTWPEMNSAIITIVENEKVKPLLAKIKQIDELNTEVGIRAFVWNVEDAY